jgi:hypothetical protein
MHIMRFAPRIHLALPLLLACAAPLTRAAAQDEKPAATVAAPVGVITGFSSIPWGTSAETIRAQLGEPLTERETQGTAVLIYTDRVLDQDVATYLYVHPTDGLVAGAYVAKFTTGNSCQEVYDAFKQAVAARYPTLRPRVTERTERSLSLCTALALHRGEANTTWQDPQSGATAFVEIHYGQDFEDRYVQTMYVSARGAEVGSRSAATERATRF